MLLVRFQANCRLLAVKVWGSQKLYAYFWLYRWPLQYLRAHCTTNLILSYLNSLWPMVVIPASSTKCKKWMLNKCLKWLVPINPFTTLLGSRAYRSRWDTGYSSDLSYLFSSFFAHGPICFRNFLGLTLQNFNHGLSPDIGMKNQRVSVPTRKSFGTGLQLEDFLVIFHTGRMCLYLLIQ